MVKEWSFFPVVNILFDERFGKYHQILACIIKQY